MRPYVESLASSAHVGVVCASCHAPGIAARADMSRRVVVEMLPTAVVAGGVSGPGEGVADAGCATCHSASLGEVIDRDGVRVLHPSCALERSCVECHGQTAHGATSRVSRTYTMESCAECHVASGATLECDACHSPHTQRERLDSGPWQVTHGSEWAQTHGLGSLTSCSVCHPSDYCVRCHGTVLPHPLGFGQSHGDEAKKNLNACAACHSTQALCTPCHTIEMPHPAGFLKQHSSAADEVEDPRCVRCHDTDECVFCHVQHVHPGGAQPPQAGD